jgi:hypothetical protein
VEGVGVVASVVRAPFVHTLARLHQHPPVHILRSLCPVCLGANLEICTVGMDGRDLGNLWVDGGADDAMNEVEPGAGGLRAHVGTPPPTSTSAYFEILVPCVSRGEHRNLHSGHGWA